MEVVVKDYDQNPPPHESSAIRFGPRKPLWLVESVTHRFVVGVVDNGEAQWSKTPPSP